MQRIFISETLIPDADVALNAHHVHYLLHVLRIKPGNEILLFNGRDGEWRAKCVLTAKKTVRLRVICKERPQPEKPDLIYCFAPLKHARFSYMIQKAVEMGVGVFQPIITQRTQITRFNLERINANATEAAEQCGSLSVPECRQPVSFDTLLSIWDPHRHLIFCDEATQANNPLSLLSQMQRCPLGLIIGPEGGFSSAEREALKALDFVTAISLGPRILRADTAAVAALTLVHATLGDWS